MKYQTWKTIFFVIKCHFVLMLVAILFGPGLGVWFLFKVVVFSIVVDSIFGTNLQELIDMDPIVLFGSSVALVYVSLPLYAVFSSCRADTPSEDTKSSQSVSAQDAEQEKEPHQKTRSDLNNRILTGAWPAGRFSFYSDLYDAEWTSEIDASGECAWVCCKSGYDTDGEWTCCESGYDTELVWIRDKLHKRKRQRIERIEIIDFWGEVRNAACSAN